MIVRFVGGPLDGTKKRFNQWLLHYQVGFSGESVTYIHYKRFKSRENGTEIFVMSPEGTLPEIPMHLVKNDLAPHDDFCNCEECR